MIGLILLLIILMLIILILIVILIPILILILNLHDLPWMQLGQEEEALARQTEVGPLSFRQKADN